ncbi:MAG: hypothetical protein ACTSUE_11735 [Promethearchaeota archaeon]
MNYGHGKWCRTRSFPTTCSACGAKLLFWACSHGCRVMFEFDKFGRLAGKHKCKARETPVKRKEKRSWFDYDNDFDLSTISKQYLEKMFEESYQCPVCGEKFGSELHYYQHLKQRKEMDDDHFLFYQENRRIITEFSGHSRATRAGQGGEVVSLNARDGTAPKKVPLTVIDTAAHDSFGRIRIKTRDGGSKLVHHNRDWYDAWKDGGGGVAEGKGDRGVRDSEGNRGVRDSEGDRGVRDSEGEGDRGVDEGGK